MLDACFEIIMDREMPDIEYMVAGFPGIGLIGGMASEQLINTLELEQVASLDCDQFPPTAVVFDGIPRRPVRFFAGAGMLLAKSDMVIPPLLTSQVAERIIEFARQNGAMEAIVFDGIQEREDAEEDNKVWAIVSRHDAAEKASKAGIELIKRGAIAGISSSLLLQAQQQDLDAICMLAEGTPQLPDPRASAKLLTIFASYKDLNIDISPLVESADQLEDQYAQLIAKTKQAQADMEPQAAHPPLYG